MLSEKLPADSQANWPPLDDQAYERPAQKLIGFLCTKSCLSATCGYLSLKATCRKRSIQTPHSPHDARTRPAETTTDLLAEETVTPM